MALNNKGPVIDMVQTQKEVARYAGEECRFLKGGLKQRVVRFRFHSRLL